MESYNIYLFLHLYCGSLQKSVGSVDLEFHQLVNSLPIYVDIASAHVNVHVLAMFYKTAFFSLVALIIDLNKIFVD